MAEFSESKYKDRINEIKKEQTIKKILDIIPHSEVVFSIEKIVKENEETKGWLNDKYFTDNEASKSNARKNG